MHDMDCREVIKHMAQYLDRELSSEEQQEVQKHLGECGSCANAFRWENSMLVLVKNCAGEELPQGLTTKIFESFDCCE